MTPRRRVIIGQHEVNGIGEQVKTAVLRLAFVLGESSRRTAARQWH